MKVKDYFNWLIIFSLKIGNDFLKKKTINLIIKNIDFLRIKNRSSIKI